MVKRHCDVCWKAVREEAYQDHLHSHDRMTCPECFKDFSNQAKYTMHLRTHQRKPQFSCPICEQSMPDHISLVRHQRGHLEVVTFSCQVCQLAFTQKNLCNNHMRKAHGVEGRTDERTTPLVIDISEDRPAKDTHRVWNLY